MTATWKSPVTKGEPWDSVLHDPSLLGRGIQVTGIALDHAVLHFVRGSIRGNGTATANAYGPIPIACPLALVAGPSSSRNASASPAAQSESVEAARRQGPVDA
jgi:hypothetical protein